MNILIVDDSKAMRMIVLRTLRQAGYGDHDVQEATNGREALEAIQLAPPDLVLTDWNMPEMSGLELVQTITDRELPIKVGMITSQGTAEMRQQAKNAGALFLLSKPFTADSFREALEPLLG